MDDPIRYTAQRISASNPGDLVVEGGIRRSSPSQPYRLHVYTLIHWLSVRPITKTHWLTKVKNSLRLIFGNAICAFTQGPASKSSAMHRARRGCLVWTKVAHIISFLLKHTHTRARTHNHSMSSQVPPGPDNRGEPLENHIRAVFSLQSAIFFLVIHFLLMTCSC